ncbi:hypothetical protein Plhal710r2_c057g0166231 [Plasmopara halstedii]
MGGDGFVTPTSAWCVIPFKARFSHPVRKLRTTPSSTIASVSTRSTLLIKDTGISYRCPLSAGGASDVKRKSQLMVL